VQPNTGNSEELCRLTRGILSETRLTALIPYKTSVFQSNTRPVFNPTLALM
jgi:hypothetical protein